MTLPSFERALARGSTETLFAVTPTGRVLSWSRVAELAFGWTRAEIVGRSILAHLVAPENVDDVERALQEAARSGEATTTGLARRRDGTLFDEPLAVRVVRRGSGPETSLVFTAGRAVAPPSTQSVRVVHAETVPTPERPTLLLPADPMPSDAVDVPVVGEASSLLAPDALEALRRESNAAMATSFEPNVMLAKLARLLVPRFADWCVVDAMEAGGAKRVAFVHRDPIANAMGASLERLPSTAQAPASATQALRTAQPVVALDAPLAPPAPTDGEDVRTLRGLGVSSFMVLPLMGRLRIVGALTLVLGPSGRRYRSADVAWAQELARRAALEVENARLNDAVQRSREQALRSAERARLLQGVVAALSDALTPREVSDVVVQQGRAALGATGGAIAVITEERTSIEVVGTSGPAEALFHAWRRFPIHARLPLADAARSGEAVYIEHMPAAASRYPHLASVPGALSAVPLVVDGRAVGALGLTFPDRRGFDAEERGFITALARQTANALERARLYNAERSARARADAEARRSSFLAEASRILAVSFDTAATIEEVARLVIPTLADWCAVYVKEEDAPLRTVALVHHDAKSAPTIRVLRETCQPESDGAIAKVLASGRSEVYFDVPDDTLVKITQDERHAALLRELGLRSQVVLPLVARGRTVGAMRLAYGATRRYGATDLPIAEELARRVALALDNARLYRLSQESEERYRLLVDGVQDHAFYLLAPGGRIESWNAGAQRLLGYSSEEALGASRSIFYRPEDLATGLPDTDLEKATADGRYEADLWRVKKDGTAFFANVVITALREPSGELRGFSVLVHDLTEPRRSREAIEHARAQVQRSEKLSTLGTLVTGVGHEIKTPLTAIMNNLYGMKFQLDRAGAKGLSKDAIGTMGERVTEAIGSVDRINKLVEDLRRFAKVKVEKRDLIGLEVVVAEALNLFRAAHRGRVEVQADLQPTPPCMVDSLQIQQVVLNLLQNASEAMPHGGSVTLQTAPHEEGAAILVEDTGGGMPPQVHARMFEEFFTTKPEGTGLGLSIVRRIAEEHNARIACDTTLGVGTRFTLVFPSAR